MRKIAIQNLKGGSGKTLTAINLAAAWATMGHRVLLIDTDAQGSIGASLGLKHDLTLSQLLLEDVKLEACIINARPNIDCILSSKQLAVTEMQLISLPRREEFLRLRLQDLQGYDFVILDCAPSISLLHQNALLYAEELLIPVSMDFLALLGASQILESVSFLRRYYDWTLTVTGFLPVFVDHRLNITAAVLDALKTVYSKTGRILPQIPVDANLLKSLSRKKTIFEYNPKSRAAEAFLQVAKLLAEREVGRGEAEVAAAEAEGISHS